MRICVLQGMMAMTVCSLAIAHNNYAQLLDQRLTLSLKDVSLQEALKRIETVTNVKFFYSIDQYELELTDQISIEIQDQTLREVLTGLLHPHQIKYKVDEKDFSIALKKRELVQDDEVQYFEPREDKKKQSNVVTGKVVEGITQLPMPGVNVLIKGSTVGTTTDTDGKFTIEAEDEDVLIFSFIGYASFETQVKGKSVISIELQEDVKSLNEVIVNAGYWEVDKKESTGTIAKVTSKEIDKQPVANVLQALQGRMSGVVITPNTGAAGGAINIQIRGQNSLRSEGNYPLYIVDGVPIDSRPTESLSQIFFKGVDPINTINPANIESIEILKDADATSIYGSRGANGVVLITTKKAKAGKSSLDIHTYYGLGQVSQRMDLLHTDQYLQMRNEAIKNDDWLPFLENSAYDQYFPDLKIWSQQDDTDWQNALFGGTANISDSQISLGAGNATTSFRIGGGIHRETTVFPGDFTYQKATAHISLNHSALNNRFHIAMAVNYGRDTNDLFAQNIVYDALTLSPNAPSFTSSGDVNWSGYDSNRPNPYSYFSITHNNETSSLISNATLSYNIGSGFKIKTSMGYTATGSKEVINTPETAIAPSSTAPRKSTFGTTLGNSWIVEPQVTYEREFGKGRLNILTGMTWQSRDNDAQWIAGSGYASDDLLGNINAASQISNLGASETEYKYNAVFGRLAYNLDEKYFINLTGRRDGSSRFGSDNRFANFGSIGAAWIFSRESLFQNENSVFSFGKVRASYGTSGSDQISDYGYLSTYSASPFNYQGQAVLLPDGLSNLNFAWEINKKLEAALDLGFFKDRIALSVNAYQNQSSNQLVGYTLPSTTGFGTVQANLDAIVQNRGLEIELTTANIESDNWKWTTSINFTLPKNKLVSYPDLESSSYANTYIVGMPLSILKVYNLQIIDPATGFYQFQDADNNGSINMLDRQAVANLGRKFYGGINNAVKYKGVELSFLIDFVKQTAIDFRGMLLEGPGRMVNQPAEIMEQDRWLESGDVADIQKFTNNNTEYEQLRISNANITDASFIRLKSISLSYNLPAALTSKIKLSAATVYLQGQNIWTITKYNGLDPEMPGTAQLPQLKFITAGLKLQF